MSSRRSASIAVAIASMVLGACGIASDESPRDVPPADQLQLGVNIDRGAGDTRGSSRIYLLAPTTSGQSPQLQPVARDVEESPAALLDALFVAQEEAGYLRPDGVAEVAGALDLAPSEVASVASFYHLFHFEPVGREVIQVCTNISCMLRGGDDLLAHVEKKLGCKAGESTPDGKFYIKVEEECLAACCGAPMMMVDHVYHENLTPNKADEILDAVKD